MENEYYAYINYILFKDYDDNDLMKKITLPDGKKIDKYIFYSEIKKFLPYGVYLDTDNVMTIKCLKKASKNFILNGKQMDEDINRLFKNIQSLVSEQSELLKNSDKLSYEKIYDILLKLSVLYENIYMSRQSNDTVIKYRTSSYELSHILSFVETIFNFKKIGIYNAGFNIDKLMKKLHINFLPHIFYGPFLSILKKDNFRQSFESIYFEILLLLTNEYNERLKEIYGNEW